MPLSNVIAQYDHHGFALRLECFDIGAQSSDSARVLRQTEWPTQMVPLQSPPRPFAGQARDCVAVRGRSRALQPRCKMAWPQRVAPRRSLTQAARAKRPVSSPTMFAHRSLAVSVGHVPVLSKATCVTHHAPRRFKITGSAALHQQPVARRGGQGRGDRRGHRNHQCTGASRSSSKAKCTITIPSHAPSEGKRGHERRPIQPSPPRRAI